MSFLASGCSLQRIHAQLAMYAFFIYIIIIIIFAWARPPNLDDCWYACIYSLFLFSRVGHPTLEECYSECIVVSWCLVIGQNRKEFSFKLKTQMSDAFSFWRLFVAAEEDIRGRPLEIPGGGWQILKTKRQKSCRGFFQKKFVQAK